MELWHSSLWPFEQFKFKLFKVTLKCLIRSVWFQFKTIFLQFICLWRRQFAFFARFHFNIHFNISFHLSFKILLLFKTVLFLFYCFFFSLAVNKLNNLFEEFSEQVVNQVFSVQSLHVDHRLMSWFQADTIDNIELNMERAQNEVEEGEIIIEEARELVD